MSDTPTRFPLAWPIGRPRRPWNERKAGKFSMTGERGYKVDISVAAAMDRLEEEVRRLGGVNMLLSTNIDTRLDGRPRSGQSEPKDPGVCLYFTLKGKPLSMPCDAYHTVAQNIAALAAHIEATRAIERHGVATGAETLQAFQALPAPDHTLPGRRSWREVLGFEGDFFDSMDKAEAAARVQRRWKSMVIEHGHNEAELANINIARDAALKEFS
jgi:hypothetical protein